MEITMADMFSKLSIREQKLSWAKIWFKKNCSFRDKLVGDWV